MWYKGLIANWWVANCYNCWRIPTLLINTDSGVRRFCLNCMYEDIQHLYIGIAKEIR